MLPAPAAPPGRPVAAAASSVTRRKARARSASARKSWRSQTIPARSMRSPLPNGDHASRILSEPENTRTPAACRRLTGGIGTGPGAVVMIATPARASAEAVASNKRVVEFAETEGVAHRDPAGKAERRGALGDHLQFARAYRAAVVQVNVDADAAPFGDAEDDVEMRFGVAVDALRIEAADEIGAFARRRVEEIGDAGLAQDARLRKGDDLHVDEMRVSLLELQQRFEPGEPGLGVDVDMAAQRRRPIAPTDARSAGRRAPRPRAERCGAAAAPPRCGRRSCRREYGAGRAGRSASCRDGHGLRQDRAEPACRPRRSVRRPRARSTKRPSAICNFGRRAVRGARVDDDERHFGS